MSLKTAPTDIHKMITDFAEHFPIICGDCRFSENGICSVFEYETKNKDCRLFEPKKKRL